jgi:hypothetical protein
LYNWSQQERRADREVEKERDRNATRPAVPAPPYRTYAVSRRHQHATASTASPRFNSHSTTSVDFRDETPPHLHTPGEDRLFVQFCLQGLHSTRELVTRSHIAMRAKHAACCRDCQHASSVIVVNTKRGVRSVSPSANLRRGQTPLFVPSRQSAGTKYSIKRLVQQHGPDTSDALRGLRALSFSAGRAGH